MKMAHIVLNVFSKNICHKCVAYRYTVAINHKSAICKDGTSYITTLLLSRCLNKIPFKYVLQLCSEVHAYFSLQTSNFLRRIGSYPTIRIDLLDS